MNRLYREYLKRVLDIFLSGTAIIALSPLIGVIALLVIFRLGPPVLFRQDRPGKDERIFTMYKFRTMTDKKDELGCLLPDCDRLTEFGRRLRNTSLDELPELFNVFKGDMSIIGPRPQLVRDLVFMTPEQRRRHLVRPGVSGLAQCSGRNQISWEKKFEYDLDYLRHISFWFDFKIVLKTIVKVLERDGITSDGAATAVDLGDYLLLSHQVSREYYSKCQDKAQSLLSYGKRRGR